MTTTNIFQSVAMPEDHYATVNHQRMYTLAQISKFCGTSTGALNSRCNDGSLPYILLPGLSRPKLVPESELRTFLLCPMPTVKKLKPEEHKEVVAAVESVSEVAGEELASGGLVAGKVYVVGEGI